MSKLYDYTCEKNIVLGSFDNWLDAQKALERFKNNNPNHLGFIINLYALVIIVKITF